jgi:hypothetical protein
VNGASNNNQTELEKNNPALYNQLFPSKRGPLGTPRLCKLKSLQVVANGAAAMLLSTSQPITPFTNGFTSIASRHDWLINIHQKKKAQKWST